MTRRMRQAGRLRCAVVMGTLALAAALGLGLSAVGSAVAARPGTLHVRRFSSPDHKVSCEILDVAEGGPEVGCNVFNYGHNGFHSAYIDARGVGVCNRPSGARYCGALGGRFPALPYGRSTEAEGFRCSSEGGWIVCIRASGKRAGLGFRIDRDHAVKVRRAVPKSPAPGPGEGATGVSHAQLWTALEGQVTCGVFVHYRPPPRADCSAQGARFHHRRTRTRRTAIRASSFSSPQGRPSPRTSANTPGKRQKAGAQVTRRRWSRVRPGDSYRSASPAQSANRQ
jgi:hypothetical protein